MDERAHASQRVPHHRDTLNDTLAVTPNVRVIDWSAMVAPSPATYITGADLVHLTATGISWRPVLLASTLVANA